MNKEVSEKSLPEKEKTLLLYCDGASRGNPGPGSYGFVIFDGDTAIYERGETLGIVTNNVAEYQALIHGLKKCLELKAKHVTVKSDSELLVRQISGRYKVRSPLIIPLYDEVKKLLPQFTTSQVNHVRREENSLADALANLALDRAKG